MHLCRKLDTIFASDLYGIYNGLPSARRCKCPICRSYRIYRIHHAINNCNISPRACQGGHLEVVNLLLGKGADGSPNTITGVAPLNVACLSGNVELVKLMVQVMPQAINIPSKIDSFTALHAAAGEGNEAMIKSILQIPG